MCRLAYHNCPTCGEEYRCEQYNSECPVINGYEAGCAKCEYWVEETQRDYEREDNREREARERWTDEHGDW